MIRVAPSTRLRKAMRVVTNENQYMEGLDSRARYLTQMEQAMDSDFGLTLIAAMEQLEANAYATLFKTNMKWRVSQAKAEIKTAKYIKSIFMTFRAEKNEVVAMQKQLNEDVNNEAI